MGCEYSALGFHDRVSLITAARNSRCAIRPRHLTRILQGELVTNARLKDGGVDYGILNVEGQHLCLEAYRQVCGWSKNVWYNAKSNVRSHLLAGKDASCPFDNASEDLGSMTEVKHREATTRAYGWCHTRLDEIADGVDPSSRGPKKAQRMLDKQDLNEWYLEYLQAMEDRGDQETVCPSTFTKAYSQARQELNIMDRQWLPFAQCAQCSELKLRLSKATSKVDRDQVRKERTEHLVFQTKMRRAYYAHRELAEQEPETYLSTIADGMDQAKVRVPRFGRESKSLTHQMDIGLEAALYHGSLRRVWFYLVPHTYKGGSNVTIHCLNESLKGMQKAYQDAKMTWPKIWFLQLDNTTKENKNQYVLAWLQTLVDTQVFQEIYVSFLPVGHTHEDIDQRFSVVSRALRRQTILSVQHMTAFLAQFFKVVDIVINLIE